VIIETYPGLFTWGTYLWFTIGLATGIGFTLLIRWLRERNIKTSWYDWLIGIVGILLLFFTIQNFYAGFQERVSQASWMFALVTGVPSLVLLGIPALQVWRRNRKTA